MKLYDKCLDCIVDMIGITGCVTPLPCVLNIDSLNGISAEFLEAILDPAKHDGYLSILNDAKKLAMTDFKTDVRSQFGKYATFKKEILTTKRPNVYTPLTAFSSTKTKFGIYIELPENEHQLFEVYKAYFFPRNAGTVTIKIAEPLTGVVLYTESIAVTNQYYEYEIDKSFLVQFNSESVVVYIETPDVVFNQITCGGLSANGYRSCGTCGDFSQFSFTPVAFDNVTDLNTTSKPTIDYTPFCIDAAINCSLEQIMCDNKFKYEFARIYMEKVYLRLIEFQILSPQINYLAEANFIMIKDEIKPAKTKDYYAKLGTLVKDVVKSISADSICFTCEPENGSGFSWVTR